MSYQPILFQSTYHPYLVDEDFKRLYGERNGELLNLQSYWYLYLTLRQCLKIEGEFWECGVYQGSSAKFIRDVIKDKVLRLFDTFCGMPETSNKDPVHKKGDFNDTSLERVKEKVKAEFHPGVIPETFKGLEDSQIAFAHIDVDIYQSVKDCCEFIYPRVNKGGLMLFDDYGHPSCLGARLAVEEYFGKKNYLDRPIINLYTGQALVIK